MTVIRNSNLKVSGSGTGYIMQQSVQLWWQLHTKLKSCKVTDSSNIIYVQIEFLNFSETASPALPFLTIIIIIIIIIIIHCKQLHHYHLHHSRHPTTTNNDTTTTTTATTITTTTTTETTLSSLQDNNAANNIASSSWCTK